MLLALKWDVLVKRCFQQRTGVSKFQSYVDLLSKEDAIDGERLCALILSRLKPHDECIDPLIPTYFEGILAKNLVRPHDALQALVDFRKHNRASETHDTFTDASMSIIKNSALDQTLMMFLARGFSLDSFQHDKADAPRLFNAMSSWVDYLVGQNEDVMIATAAASSQDVMQAQIVTRESFTTMMITCLANPHIAQGLKGDSARGEVKP